MRTPKMLFQNRSDTVTAKLICVFVFAYQNVGFRDVAHAYYSKEAIVFVGINALR